MKNVEIIPRVAINIIYDIFCFLVALMFRKVVNKRVETIASIKAKGI